MFSGADQFIRRVKLSGESSSEYPFSIPAVKDIESIHFDNPVTFLVGENGSGKSTIVEAIAVAAGFSAEGGTKNYNFSSVDSTSSLSDNIVLVRGVIREEYGYFLRAESFYTTANYADTGTALGPLLFDGKRIHEQSHGEAFLSIMKESRKGLFIFDEPESALSPQRQLSLMVMMNELAREGSQFIVATHSPILMAYPEARIYQLSSKGLSRVEYGEIDHVNLTRDFLNNPSAYLGRLFKD